MGNNISEMSVEKNNTIFKNKLEDYLSFMKMFLNENELEERKREILDNFHSLVSDYENSKGSYVTSDSLDISNIDSFTNMDKIHKKNKSIENMGKRIINTLNDELEFLRFITSDFTSNTHGLVFKTSDGKELYNGIDDSISFALIRSMALLKAKNNEPFELPDELKKDDEKLRYFQIKDRIVMDMQDLFGDEVYRQYFLGKSKEFNSNLNHIFIMEATTLEDEIKQVETKNKDNNENNAIIDIAAKNLIEFNNGINSSIKENDEFYYNKYVQVINRYKEMTKNVNWTDIDEMVEKRRRGLK